MRLLKRVRPASVCDQDNELSRLASTSPARPPRAAAPSSAGRPPTVCASSSRCSSYCDSCCSSCSSSSLVADEDWRSPEDTRPDGSNTCGDRPPAAGPSTSSASLPDCSPYCCELLAPGECKDARTLLGDAPAGEPRCCAAAGVRACARGPSVGVATGTSSSGWPPCCPAEPAGTTPNVSELGFDTVDEELPPVDDEDGACSPPDRAVRKRSVSADALLLPGAASRTGW